MTQRIDIPVGAAFGRLIVIGRDESRTRVHWVCRCACGADAVVQSFDLRTGHTVSCGCHKREGVIERLTTHGMSDSSTYEIWCGMIKRCTNPDYPRWEYYGGRGIKVCRRWRKFENFLSDMGERPAKLTLDRINNDDHYRPGNCRWATMKQQSNNRRPRRSAKRPKGEIHAASR